ncbi:hypothetical protein Glove_1g37 [Diversispora epigaea]|uniref:Uncharacterized protein n=1 Tax=Diversispora epigaea TaxID=1348612 RepID=A0A397JQQ3_9GLOM|nr:hypothetical protein Glove_1g37 [Diversispora epigaea]
MAEHHSIKNNKSRKGKNVLIFPVSAVTSTPLDRDKHDVDFNDKQTVDNMYYQELSLVETLLSSVIEKLANSKNGIARYWILFLPENNLHNPIKRLFTNEEWLTMESNWKKVDKKITTSS